MTIKLDQSKSTQQYQELAQETQTLIEVINGDVENFQAHSWGQIGNLTQCVEYLVYAEETLYGQSEVKINFDKNNIDLATAQLVDLTKVCLVSVECGIDDFTSFNASSSKEFNWAHVGTLAQVMSHLTQAFHSF